MKKSLVSTFAALLFLTFHHHCSLFKNTRPSTAKAFNLNELATYGQYVYQKEKCAICHTFQVEKARHKIVSLDGLGGKYSGLWYYYMLADPQVVNPEATMPGYPHLFNTALDKRQFQKLTLGQTPEQLEFSWNQLIAQADTLKTEINDQGEQQVSHSEVLALIAFLQQLPASAGKIKKDSLEMARFKKEVYDWESLLADQTSLLHRTAANPENMAAGKVIFNNYCILCHGHQGQGGIGPNLTDPYWLHGGKPASVLHTVVYGVPEKGMPVWGNMLTPKEIGEIVAYIQSIQGSNPPDAKAPQGAKE
ncbi:MAG: c-type cytochrome [Saprospiraceae bacterium]|nr:c-type cytochrome [Saprospiraceae bacterium]